MSLRRDWFPHRVTSASEFADAWWDETVDLIVFGLERMPERSLARSRTPDGPA
jgi:hypothetical protein